MNTILIIIFICILAIFVIISKKRKNLDKKDIAINTVIFGMGTILVFFFALMIFSSFDNKTTEKIEKYFTTQTSSIATLYPLESGAYYDDITMDGAFILNIAGEGSTNLKAYKGNISLKYDTSSPYVEFIFTDKNKERCDDWGIISKFFQTNYGESIVIHLTALDNSRELNEKYRENPQTNTTIKTSDYLQVETDLETNTENIGEEQSD